MRGEPKEITYQIGIRVPPKDVLIWCQTNKKFRNICLDDNFWRLYYERWVDKNNLISETGTWRQRFIENYSEVIPKHLPNYPFLVWQMNSRTMIDQLYFNISTDDVNVILVPCRNIKGNIIIYPYHHQFRFYKPGSKSERVTEGKIRGRSYYHYSKTADDEPILMYGQEFLFSNHYPWKIPDESIQIPHLNEISIEVPELILYK